MVGLLYFYASIPTKHATPDKADAIVVLTGGNDRIAEGVRLLADGRADKLLITGVNKKSNFSELISVQGVDDILAIGATLTDKISLGRKALTTVGNAKETKEWVAKNEVKSIIVVTSNYHMPRALVEFRRLMPKIDMQAYAVLSPKFDKTEWSKDKNTRDIILREYHKFIYAVFLG